MGLAYAPMYPIQKMGPKGMKLYLEKKVDQELVYNSIVHRRSRSRKYKKV